MPIAYQWHTNGMPMAYQWHAKSIPNVYQSICQFYAKPNAKLMPKLWEERRKKKEYRVRR
jgi:hypothetical protein